MHKRMCCIGRNVYKKNRLILYNLKEWFNAFKVKYPKVKIAFSSLLCKMKSRSCKFELFLHLLCVMVTGLLCNSMLSVVSLRSCFLVNIYTNRKKVETITEGIRVTHDNYKLFHIYY